ncbi:MAG: hypothetical protein EOM91_20240 [Sphingobacteriia bacterium]|nr:hypothetical protein [Sphingobacteriia bacterium]NCC41575.1 hypothetical protein [Gammaproteobacteria bacterium]
MTTAHQLIADLVLFGITLAACTGAFLLLVARNRARRERDLLTARVAQLGELIRIQGTEIESLARFRQVRDAAERLEQAGLGARVEHLDAGMEAVDAHRPTAAAHATLARTPPTRTGGQSSRRATRRSAAASGSEEARGDERAILEPDPS